MFNMLKQFSGPGRLKANIAMVTSAGAVAIILPFVMPQAAQANNHEDFQRGDSSAALVGTWNVQVTLDSASVPPGTHLDFISLVTFNVGGGFMESNNGPGAGGPGGQGNWAQTGHHRFAVTELRLGFDLGNAYTGLNKIRRSLTLSRDGDEFIGKLQADIYLPNGTLLPIHPSGTFHGVRVPIEPLN